MFFVLYDYTTNAILATPMKDSKDESMIKAFKENIECLRERGFKPSFNIIDNVASKAIKNYHLSLLSLFRIFSVCV